MAIIQLHAFINLDSSISTLTSTTATLNGTHYAYLLYEYISFNIYFYIYYICETRVAEFFNFFNLYDFVLAQLSKCFIVIGLVSIFSQVVKTTVNQSTTAKGGMTVKCL